MVGYEMGFSLAGVYTTVENFKHGWQNDMDVNMATLFVGGILWRSSFLSYLKPLNKNLIVNSTYHDI